MNFRKVSTALLVLSFASVPALKAEVKTQERTKVQFVGPLGGIMKVFGGKSYRDGLVTSVSLKGNRKMSITGDNAELIDLTEEKVYQIDMKGKNYRVMTFEQMRRQMQEAMEKAKASAPKNEPAAKSNPNQPQYEIDFKVQDTGQKKTIAGYNTHEVMATITMREKGKKADEGAFVVTSSMWLAPKIAALKEIEDFDRKFAEKLLLPFAKDLAEQMAPAMAQYPQLTNAMAKLQAETVKMDGAPISTVVQFGALVPPDQAAAQQPAAQEKKSETPRSIGGLLGGLGKKAVNRNKDEDSQPATNSQPGALMTSTTELISVGTSVSDSEVAIPANFKEKK